LPDPESGHNGSISPCQLRNASKFQTNHPQKII
jgi:hypothetical protein